MLASAFAATPVAGADEFAIRVTDQQLNQVDSRLFGHFLEIASFGELGPEALVDPDTGRLPEEVVQQLKQLRPTVIRFPGGIDIDYLDWTDRIDLPGRPDGERRPTSQTRGNTLTNYFGYDEFLELAAELDTQPLLVVNLRRSLEPGADVAAAAEHAAALVAYCNADVDSERLTATDKRWAQQRVANGHAKPWSVPLWQVGNETWNYLDDVAKANGLTDPAEIGRWYVDRLVAYAEAMRRVAPGISLIADGYYLDPELRSAILSDPRLAEHYDFLALHTYAPGGPIEILRGGEPVEPTQLSLPDLWYAFVSMPGYFEEDRVYAKPPGGEPWDASPRWALTEWNWNGWGNGIRQNRRLVANAQGLGAAAYVHGMIRQGDQIQLATQSMMLGVSWDLAGVAADTDGSHPPYVTPSGAAVALASEHHGTHRLAIEHASPMPRVDQPLRLRGWGEHPATDILPLLDVVATEDEESLYLHVVHRGYNEPRTLVADIAGADSASDQVEAILYVPRDDSDAGVATRDAMRRTTNSHSIADGQLRIELPPRSFGVVIVPRQQ